MNIPNYFFRKGKEIMNTYNEKLKDLVEEIVADAIEAALDLQDEDKLLISKQAIVNIFPHDYSPEIAQAANKCEQILCSTLVGLAADYVRSLKKNVSTRKGK